jgi:hypothetical protein
MNEDILIPKWAWIILGIAVVLGLGYWISPLDRDGRPLLLSPDVKAVEDYRRSLVAWHAKLAELDGRIARVLSNDYGGDLFSQSSDGQKALNETLQVLNEIDQTATIPAAVPARELALNVANTTLIAAQSALIWVSAPTPANLSSAQQALETAHTNMAILEASQWMTPR